MIERLCSPDELDIESSVSGSASTKGGLIERILNCADDWKSCFRTRRLKQGLNDFFVFLTGTNALCACQNNLDKKGIERISLLLRYLDLLHS